MVLASHPLPVHGTVSYLAKEKGLHMYQPAWHPERMSASMNIQEAIQSGKPFRRKGWVDDDIFVVYQKHDIVLTLENDPSTPIELDVQDILADDWYIRDDLPLAS